LSATGFSILRGQCRKRGLGRTLQQGQQRARLLGELRFFIGTKSIVPRRYRLFDGVDFIGAAGLGSNIGPMKMVLDISRNTALGIRPAQADSTEKNFDKVSMLLSPE
jgi:hypothetical protein